MSTGGSPNEGSELSVWFWPALVLGWIGIWFGIHTMNRDGISLVEAGKYVVGGLVAHDALWAPAAVVVGLVTARWLPVWLRTWVRIALALSAMLFLATRPVTGRYGATASNPSIDPGNAGGFLLVVIAVVWATCLGLAGFRRLRGSDGAAHPDPEPARP